MGEVHRKKKSEYRIAKMLKYYGRNEIDAVFVTHGDEDHVNGIEELAERQEKEGIKIRRILVLDLQGKRRRTAEVYTDGKR